MHFSGKRGLAIACRLSVRPSVTLVDCDHISWNSSEIISPLVSPGCSLSEAQTSGSTPRGTPEIFAQIDPPTCWFKRRRHSIANCGRSQWYRSFEWCHRWPHTTSPPKRGFHMPPRHANGHISATGDPIHFMFGSSVGFSGSADRMALFPVTSNPSWRQAAIFDNFEWRYLRNGSFYPLI